LAVIVSVEEFLKEFSVTHPVVLDVRSPKEFNHAQIPGAINFPLLNDEERQEVGITYKNDGREAAVIKGFELVGNKFSDFIKTSWHGCFRSVVLKFLY
jgi:tRNA 2-selenouridine synthase